MKKYFFLFMVLAVAFGCKKEDDNDAPITVKDIDGNVYKTVKIGDQLWMAENLRVSRLNDGTLVPEVTTGWESLTTAAFCWYNNDSAQFEKPYGKLYNGYVTNAICPTGWHIPSIEEWNTLFEYLGGTDVAGGMMKETDTIHWRSPNVGATNTSGFSAVSTGRHAYNGNFVDFPYNTGFWTDQFTGVFNIYHGDAGVFYNTAEKVNGYAIRCIQDTIQSN